MGDVLRLAGFTHPITLDGFGKDHGRLSRMPCRCRISRIDFMRIMTAAVQAPDVIVRHIGDHFQQLGIFAEKMFTDIGTVSRFESLIFAVYTFHHALLQQTLGILGKQWIPV